MNFSLSFPCCSSLPNNTPQVEERATIGQPLTHGNGAAAAVTTAPGDKDSDPDQTVDMILFDSDSPMTDTSPESSGDQVQQTPAQPFSVVTHGDGTVASAQSDGGHDYHGNTPSHPDNPAPQPISIPSNLQLSLSSLRTPTQVTDTSSQSRPAPLLPRKTDFEPANALQLPSSTPPLPSNDPTPLYASKTPAKPSNSTSLPVNSLSRNDTASGKPLNGHVSTGCVEIGWEDSEVLEKTQIAMCLSADG